MVFLGLKLQENRKKTGRKPEENRKKTKRKPKENRRKPKKTRRKENHRPSVSLTQMQHATQAKARSRKHTGRNGQFNTHAAQRAARSALGSNIANRKSLRRSVLQLRLRRGVSLPSLRFRQFRGHHLHLLHRRPALVLSSFWRTLLVI